MGRQTSQAPQRQVGTPHREIEVPRKKQIELKMFLRYAKYALAKFR
jgi:hypothetical protein